MAEVVLGLGSNLENRLLYLRNAFLLLKKMPGLQVKRVSPLYLSDALLVEDSPPEWNKPYINLAILCETQLSPYDLLKQIKSVEITLGRKSEKRWGPRAIDIDILAWGNTIVNNPQLRIPHINLPERPFALWPLADVAPRWVYPISGPFLGKTATQIAEQWGCKFSGEAPFHTRQIPHRIDYPALVGILNLSEESFSADGKVLLTEALQHFNNLVADGAEVIDIGAESTRPNATPLDAEKEWQRLQPLLEILFSDLENYPIPPKISIDTRHPETAKKALQFPIHWINDVSGLTSFEMQEVVQESSCDAVFMHHLHIPENRNFSLPLDKDPVPFVYEWAEKKLASLPIPRDRLIFDVGIGFGKTAERSKEILQRIEEFKKLGVRLMVGHSRKSFFQQFNLHTACARDIETVAATLALPSSIDFLRVHNVDVHARAMKVFSALKS